MNSKVTKNGARNANKMFVPKAGALYSNRAWPRNWEIHAMTCKMTVSLNKDMSPK